MDILADPLKAGEVEARRHYALRGGDAIHMGFTDYPDGPGITASAVVVPKSGDAPALLSNMDLYGTERPTEQDVKDVLKRRR